MTFNSTALKQIIIDNQNDSEQYHVIPLDFNPVLFPSLIFVGIRRCGKSFILYKKIQQMLANGKKWNEMLYLNFKDARLDGFSKEDFQLMLNCHAKLYETTGPMLFLDEIQNMNEWEKFIGTLADKKYAAFIAGSNVKVYPYSFIEYLNSVKISYDDKAPFTTNPSANFIKAYNDYYNWVGLPESMVLSVKRNYINNLFQKIYLGDIAIRNNISNCKLFQLIIKKMAENVIQPIFYNRIAKAIFCVSGKNSVPTVTNHVNYSENTRLLLRHRNISSSSYEKETNCKYYFIDNGLLSLFRKYGNDDNKERVFFYKNNIEVDFFIPEDEMAIQISYSLKSIIHMKLKSMHIEN